MYHRWNFLVSHLFSSSSFCLGIINFPHS
jgi:hypothetical protein